MYWDAVARALRERMNELGKTQRQLADEADVSPTTIKELAGNWTARRRTRKTLAAISTALDWPSGKLIAIATGEVDVAQTVEEQLADLRSRVDALERNTCQSCREEH